MNKISQFYEIIKKDMSVTLATASKQSVTMRLVSPVYYKGDILIFTDPGSLKYQQLKANPNCCIAAGTFFAEAEAEFLGATMLDTNKEPREVYCGKFPGAFDESIAFGGRNAEFVLLKPTRLKGWAFENDVPTSDGVPTIPFEINI
ncbi:pyridoxamine 5'-phosphate oxidase family protein [Anaerovorax odorimutans]|uniref:Pyridoxamine 5'-phosphate oxidase family protein n=1 Tax=Anaerovorax odorimutans TaxID=109327 RepID=A0ABT1RSG0_9FIRM|nr:pyridoxamine 5'-phosphate oxidase family protein [Anaerovorax odorimutans]MCQ4638123.1 pyridoxamine 5'-phosphate oxidase family protein [Anaerovorax odorimutans]